jgi:DNA-binding IscR family transcriptional regulator
MSDLGEILISYLAKIKDLEKRVEALEKNITSLQASLSKKEERKAGTDVEKLIELLSKAASSRTDNTSIEDLLDKAATFAIKHYQVEPPKKR